MIRDTERSTPDAETSSPHYNQQYTAPMPPYTSFHDERYTRLQTSPFESETGRQAVTPTTGVSAYTWAIGRTIPPIAKTLNDLDRIAELRTDWDSYGSAPPTSMAVEKARRLVITVYQDSLLSARNPSLPFSVAPLSGGGIQLEWRSETAAIEVEIGPEGAFGYLLIKGVEPSSVCEEEDGVSESRILELVRSVQRLARNHVPIPPVQVIADTDFLYRRLAPGHISPDGFVNSNAFKLNGHPDPEPSVSLARLMNVQEALADALARGPEFKVGILSVRKLRASGFDAVHKPTDANPAHCQIIGNTQKSTCRQLAKLTNVL